MSSKDEKEKRIQDLYRMAKNPANSPPKKALFGMKCPKCAAKLQSETMKMLIVPGPGSSEFDNEVARNERLDPGAYNLTVKHHKCACGYDFVEAIADSVGD